MIRILCVGRLRAAHYRNATEDYVRRLRRFARLELVEFPDSNPTKEAQAIQGKLGRARVIACDPGGELWSSEDLSKELGNHGALDFLIGGPDGLDPSLLTRADQSVAFGRMTLPHELARVLLLEQIYRGYTILNGHPYHR
jgi:23S rRNA (pseudouridine1915-N3)-methyltransferase